MPALPNDRVLVIASAEDYGEPPAGGVVFQGERADAPRVVMELQLTGYAWCEIVSAEGTLFVPLNGELTS